MATYEVFGLGPAISRAFALNEKGQTAGVSWDSISDSPDPVNLWEWATIWNRLSGGTRLEPPPPGVTSRAEGINDGGSVVGSFCPTQGDSRTWRRHGFVSHKGSMTDLRPILGTEYSAAFDINNAGKVVGEAGLYLGTAEDPGQLSVPFVYDVEAGSPPLFPLGKPPGHDGIQRAMSINNHGAVVGVGGTPERGFLYTGDSLMGDSLIYLDNSDVSEISDSGLIAGAILQGAHWVAAVYDTNDSQPKFEPIGHLPGHTYSTARSINDKGEVVGISQVSLGNTMSRGFLYQDGVMTDLNDLIPAGSGWVLDTGLAINNAGEIAAWGSYNGQSRSCLLVPSDVFRVTRENNSLIWYVLRGLLDDTPGVVYPPGGPPIPVDPDWRRLDPNKLDVLSGLAVNQMASLIKDPDVRRHVEEAGIRVMEESVRKLREGS